VKTETSNTSVSVHLDAPHPSIQASKKRRHSLETTSSSWTLCAKLTFCACGANLLLRPHTTAYLNLAARLRWIPSHTSWTVLPALRHTGSLRSGGAPLFFVYTRTRPREAHMRGMRPEEAGSYLESPRPRPREREQEMTAVFGCRARASTCSSEMPSALL
jgi:hypothetical protein